MSLSKSGASGFCDNNGVVVEANDEAAAAAATNKAKNNLVVRINEDSDDNLKALFDSVLNPSDSKRPLQVPFRMRKLPNSFFNPPAVSARSPTVSHSRANSADSAYDAGSQQNVNKPVEVALPTVLQQAAATASATASNLAQQPPPGAATGAISKRLEICHSRAHSSPASLQQTYGLQAGGATGEIGPDGLELGGAAFPGGRSGFDSSNGGGVGGAATLGADGGGSIGQPPPNIIHNPNGTIQSFHMKQRSYDVISNIQLQNELGALPPGWEQAKTNDSLIYYLNHITKTTQWEDPRIQHKQQQQQQQQRLFQQAMQQQQQQQSVNLKEPSKEALAINEDLGPLPEGWEQAFTESGDIYFINHIERNTSWNDPRLPAFPKKYLKELKSDMNWNMRPIGKDHDLFKQRREQNALNRQSEPLPMDPFLSGDSHARQESSDSGLSLSSNTFSVNAEFMSQIDDSMDCISDNDNITLSALDCPDNLVSSLQLESNICNEMFSDVDNILNS